VSVVALASMVTPVAARRRREAAERLAALTSRESQVLHLVAEGMWRGVSTAIPRCARACCTIRRDGLHPQRQM
jgi:hypothetical protein